MFYGGIDEKFWILSKRNGKVILWDYKKNVTEKYNDFNFDISLKFEGIAIDHNLNKMFFVTDNNGLKDQSSYRSG